MSKNIHQVFVANPITLNAGTDLMYFGQSPYGVTNDAAMTYTNFSAQFTLNVLTTKGDILAYSTANGRFPIAVGDGKILQVSSAGAFGLAYSTPTYPSTSGTVGKILRSDGTNNVYTTSTFADTYAVSTLLYASTANGVTGLATTNKAALSTNATGVPTWLAMTDGQVVIGSTAGAPAAASPSAGTGLTVTLGSNSFSYAVNGAQPWVDQTSASVTMAVNTGYTSDDGAVLVTFTLPATSAIGDWVEINGKGSGLFTIAQAAGQQIHIGSSASTAGATGTVTSTNQWDSIKLRCVTANTIWTVSGGPQGNFTVA